MSDEILNKNVDFDIKFAHGEGHTILDINEKNNKILTGGSDGEVRCWSIDNLEDDAESFDVGTAIYSLINSPENLYVASDSIDIKYYSIDDGSYKGSIVRSTLNMYSVCLNSDYKLLACGGGDFVIKIVDLENFSVKQLEGHQAPILFLNFDPKKKYLASSSCDGSFKIWNIKDFTNVFTLEKLHDKSNDFLNSKTLCSFSWNSTGTLIAIPSQKSILIYERDSWFLKHEIKYPNFESISICIFNRTNKLLAASNSEGILIIWNLDCLEQPIAFYVNDDKTALTSLKFDNKTDKLYACDKNGQLIFLNINYNEDQSKSDNIKDDKYEMVDDFDNEDDFFDNFDEKKLKDPEKVSHKTPIIEESQESSNQQEDSQNLSLLNSQQTNNLNEMNIQIDASIFDEDDLNDEDNELIDIGALKQKYESKINESFTVDSKDKNDELVDDKPKETHVKIKPIMQPPFKPGSTPVHLENRFMVWNSVGVVTCSKSENDNIIDVEFHNSEVYRPIHMPNTYSYTMADLTIDTLVLAAPFYETENEESSPSTFFCMNFTSSDKNKDWKYQMPDSESIEAITVSQSFAILSTDFRRIRLFTLNGIQLHLFSLSGPIVCLASHQNLLSIVYHNGSGLPGEESLSMNLLKLNEKSVYPLTQLVPSTIPIALSSKSVIDWYGFTDEGNICVVDSNGYVKIFNQITRYWIPVANLKSKNKNDNYFVISISEIQEKIKCISCKGSKYPSTIPRPDVLSIQFEIPLCEITTTKSKLEEQLIRINLRNILLEKLSLNGFDVEFSNEENKKKQIEILIKLFALAVNADCNSLALEIAELLPNQLAIEGAIRYASQKNKNLIVNKLNKLIRDNFDSYKPVEENTNIVRTNKFSKKRNVSVDENDVLKPKMIKLSNENNPFKTN